MTELKPCPICGKTPKIIRHYDYEDRALGAWCTIECQPFLRQPHLKIEDVDVDWERALQYAIEAWNETVDNYEQKRVVNFER